MTLPLKRIHFLPERKKNEKVLTHTIEHFLLRLKETLHHQFFGS